MSFDKKYVLNVLKEILQIDSPSGFTDKAMAKIAANAKALGYTFSQTKKGAGNISITGSSEKTICISCHVDTLGLMVRSIKEDGTLAFTVVGSPTIPTLDGEYCKIYTRDGAMFTGTVLCNYASSHVFKEAGTEQRNENNMHIRLDEKVRKKADVLSLGISAGDFICIDTKTEITKNDFIKSRFLDDKAAVAIIFGILKHIKEAKILPKYNVKFMFSNYEEVGHGLSYIPAGVSEVISIDMGCVGSDLNGSEYDVSICAKDSGGPYDYALTSQLIKLAKDNKLQYAVDIYPSYSSDTTAALRAGNDIRGALIGPGIAASHGMERTNYEAIENTMSLLCLYLGF